MNKELRNEYDTIQEILVKLYRLLNEAREQGNKDEDLKVILDSIESVKKDEKEVLLKMRKSIYSKYTLKDINEYSELVEKRKRRKEKLEKKKEQERRIKEFDDARIVFDGYYKLIYNNGTKMVSRKIDRQLLDKNVDFVYDYNICDFLKYLDDENGTSLYRRYRNGELNVTYDFYNTKKVDRKTIKQLKKVSKESSERNESVSVVGIKRRTLKGVLATASVAALVGLSTLGITSIFKKNNKSEITNNYSVSNDVNKVEDSNTVTFNEAIVKDTENIIERTQESVMSTVTNSKELIVKETNDVIIKTQESINKKIEKPIVEEKTDEFNGLEIGSTVKLPDMDLYYSSTDTNPVGNTKYLSAPTGIYKISLISIVYKGRCIEVLSKSTSLDDLRDYVLTNYGEEVKIFVNFDVVTEEGKTVYKNVGWTDSEILYQKTKVMIK